jgi:hypothetical protein
VIATSLSRARLVPEPTPEPDRKPIPPPRIGTAAESAGPRPGGSVEEPAFVSIWVLYWSFAVLFLAGFAVDLWRGVAVRRSLQEQAEAAAAAGANGVDTGVFRVTGEVVIDPAEAARLAGENLASQDEADLVESAAVTVDPATHEVTVALSTRVDFTLIHVFLPNEEPVTVDVEASAAPRIGDGP